MTNCFPHTWIKATDTVVLLNKLLWGNEVALSHCCGVICDIKEGVRPRSKLHLFKPKLYQEFNGGDDFCQKRTVNKGQQL